MNQRAYVVNVSWTLKVMSRSHAVTHVLEKVKDGDIVIMKH